MEEADTLVYMPKREYVLLYGVDTTFFESRFPVARAEQELLVAQEEGKLDFSALPPSANTDVNRFQNFFQHSTQL